MCIGGRRRMTIDTSKYTNLPNLEFEVHWPRYFEDFCAIHGEPITVRGRLLFPDGWGYGMQYEGPEYRPPEDPEQLRQLQIEYWRESLKLRQSLVERAEILLRLVSETQQQRSAPLSRIVSRPENGRLSTTVELVNIADLSLISVTLAEEVETCKQELEKLNAGNV